MAISDAIKRKADSAIVAVRNSTLPMEMQDNLIEAIESTRDTTNGFTQEEKLQLTTENQFMIVRLLTMHMINANKEAKKTWKDVLIECKREFAMVVVALAIILGILFGIRPQLADHIDPITKHIMEQQNANNSTK
jgi:hypothetical protein